tara:strand:- start:2623 stop:3630 length:1008 start_codon:yes stop_codon:yes gene_type:complete
MRYIHRVTVWCLTLSTLLIIVSLVSSGIGPVKLSSNLFLKVILTIFFGETNLLTPTDVTILVTLRLPRIILAAIVGFALAAAGTVMQGFFRNPMADPSIIGVSAGAATGAVAVIAFGLSIPFGIEIAAIIGALVAAFFVFYVSTEKGHTPVATLLLAGIAVQTFLGAVVSLLLLLSGENLRQAIFWLMGHLHTANWIDISFTLPLVLLGFSFLFFFTRDLNALYLGEESAHSLGINVEQTKRLLLGVASLLTAVAVSVSGIIGFVGLIIPHIMRIIVGPDHRILLPTSALSGAIFLVIADTVARSGVAEVPVGVVTALVGAPFFIYLLRNRGGSV